MGRRAWVALLVGLKALVIGLTALGAFGGLERFEEKGFGWRLLWYPLAVLALPVCWRLFGRGRAYPYAADALLTLPFLVDVMGNVLDLYDRVGWWDDANHFANWLFLSLGAGALLLRAQLPPIVLAGLVVGFGAALVILWEIGEYLTFLQGNVAELPTAYRDTVVDMTFGLAGSVLAAIAVFMVARRPRRSAVADARPRLAESARPVPSP